MPTSNRFAVAWTIANFLVARSKEMYDLPALTVTSGPKLDVVST
jgi:hypothetical protein